MCAVRNATGAPVGDAPTGSAERVELTDAVWAELVAELRLGVLLQDEGGAVLAANEPAAELLGITREDLFAGTPPPDWQATDESGAPLPEFVDLAGQVLRTGTQLALPVMITHGSSRCVRLWVTYFPITHRGHARLLVVLRPVLIPVGHAHGLVDALTGLPNRALLFDRIGQALVRARTHGTLTSLLLLDVSGMARINAELGFHRGDLLLTVLAGRLREGLRDDHTVARYGGDRFAVVAEHPDGTGEPIAARVRDLVGRTTRLGGHRITPAARVRWATSDGSSSVHDLVARVESRLLR
jgi:diguanylate cyclase (GGDEF)-like protein